MRNKQKGFSLIELLIVVAIILIIASIALPNLLRAKMAANEASAVSALRMLNTKAVAHSTTYGGYPAHLTALGPATTPSSTAAPPTLSRLRLCPKACPANGDSSRTRQALRSAKR